MKSGDFQVFDSVVRVGLSLETEMNVMLSNSLRECTSGLDQDNGGEIEEKLMGFLHLFEGGQWNLAIDWMGGAGTKRRKGRARILVRTARYVEIPCTWMREIGGGMMW